MIKVAILNSQAVKNLYEGEDIEDTEVLIQEIEKTATSIIEKDAVDALIELSTMMNSGVFNDDTFAFVINEGNVYGVEPDFSKL